MLDAAGRKKRAKKASQAAARKRTKTAQPFIKGVIAAYGFLRFGEQWDAGFRFLYEHGWEPSADFQNDYDHTAAIKIIAAYTARTDTYIYRIVRKHSTDKETHLTAEVQKRRKGPRQVWLPLTLPEPGD